LYAKTDFEDTLQNVGSASISRKTFNKLRSYELLYKDNQK